MEAFSYKGAFSAMISGAKALEIPVLWFEQNPERMGPTIPEVQELLTNQKPLAKMCFSCCGHTHLEAFQKLARKQVLLCGIETHVCIYQTAANLLRAGYEVLDHFFGCRGGIGFAISQR